MCRFITWLTGGALILAINAALAAPVVKPGRVKLPRFNHSQSDHGGTEEGASTKLNGPMTGSAATIRRHSHPESAKTGSDHSELSFAGRVVSERPAEGNLDGYRVRFNTPTVAPMAFLRFCFRYPNECKVAGSVSQAGLIKLNGEQRAELSHVNRNVNEKIRPRENRLGILKEEWILSPRYGDCNDYAVTKRHELLRSGWPASALLLAEVVIPSGEHHLVLIVRTQEEDVVLDNLRKTVTPISESNYRWVRAEQPQNPRFWSSVSVGRPSRLAMKY